MLLAFDVGNTNVTLGAFRGDQLLGAWRLPTRRDTTPDELLLQVTALLDRAGLPSSAVKAVAAACVVPPLAPLLRAAARAAFGTDCLLVDAAACGLPVLYHPPEAVGADRLVNAVAAVHLAGAPAVVVDFGTATTVDAVSPAGAYVGGAIAPGLQVSLAALGAAAALLPRVELHPPAAGLGGNTADSIRAGLIYGHAGLVDRLVEEVRRGLGEAPVLATGGLAELVVPFCRTVMRLEPHLTLRGVQLVHARLKMPR